MTTPFTFMRSYSPNVGDYKFLGALMEFDIQNPKLAYTRLDIALHMPPKNPGGDG